MVSDWATNGIILGQVVLYYATVVNGKPHAWLIQVIKFFLLFSLSMAPLMLLYLAFINYPERQRFICPNWLIYLMEMFLRPWLCYDDFKWTFFWCLVYFSTLRTCGCCMLCVVGMCVLRALKMDYRSLKLLFCMWKAVTLCEVSLERWRNSLVNKQTQLNRPSLITVLIAS